MPNVLAIVAGIPPALEGRSFPGERLSVELRGDPSGPLAVADSGGYDLLVLAEMDVEEQQAVAVAFQQHRRWRVVPVLYVHSPSAPGFAIPGSYRPELDGIVRGEFSSQPVQVRMREMARDGVSATDVVVAGPYELDPLRGRLRSADSHVALTDREAEILAILLGRPNETVSAVEIIERGWGAPADDRHLQILRRHVSNIRKKFGGAVDRNLVRTVRGAGYRVDLKNAG